MVRIRLINVFRQRIGHRLGVNSIVIKDVPYGTSHRNVVMYTIHNAELKNRVADFVIKERDI